MKYFCLGVAALLAVGCAHQQPAETTAAARMHLEERWKDKLGTATKTDFISEFGNPNWCKLKDSGEESCRFYKKLQTKWMGDDLDKKEIETFDEVIADFGTDGTLRQFKANALR
jgi:hypothetical protein